MAVISHMLIYFCSLHLSLFIDYGLSKPLVSKLSIKKKKDLLNDLFLYCYEAVFIACAVLVVMSRGSVLAGKKVQNLFPASTNENHFPNHKER